MTQKHTIRYFEHCFEKRHRKNVERIEFSQHFLLSLHLCIEILEKIHIFQCSLHINFISTHVLHLLIQICVSFCWLWFLARASYDANFSKWIYHFWTICCVATFLLALSYPSDWKQKTNTNSNRNVSTTIHWIAKLIQEYLLCVWSTVAWRVNNTIFVFRFNSTRRR